MSNPRSRAKAPRARALPSGHAIQAKQRGFTARHVGHDHTGEPDDVDPCLAADLALTKRIAEKLEQHYPAHPWMVTVTHAQGVAMIKLPLVMKRNQAFVLHIDRLGSDPGLRAVVRAGGEILERYHMPRHGFALDRFLQAREKGPYGPKPKPRLWMPEFATSARPRAPLTLDSATASPRARPDQRLVIG